MSKIEREHFAAIAYQAGFSADGVNVCTNDVIHLKEYNKFISMKDVGVTKNLYENKHNGEYIHLNETETMLGLFDSAFARIRRKILQVYEQEGMQASNILSESDIDIVIKYIALLIYRAPTFLNTVKKHIGQMIQYYVPECSKGQAEAVAQAFLLPYTIPASCEECDFSRIPLLQAFYLALKKLHFCVGVATTETVITSDRPVGVYKKEFSEDFLSLQLVTLPLTPNMIIYLMPNADVNNQFFELSEADVTESNRTVAEKAERHIISYANLPHHQIDAYIHCNQKEKQDIQASLMNHNIDLPPTTTLKQLIQEGTIQSYSPSNKQDLYISIDKSTLEMTLCQDVSPTEQSFVLYSDHTKIRTEFLYFILLELIQYWKTGKYTHDQLIQMPIVLMPIDKQEEFVEYSKNLTINMTQQAQ